MDKKDQWFVGKFVKSLVVDGDGNRIADFRCSTRSDAECEENAARAVREHNAHDELVAALRRAVEAAEARMPNATFLADARTALAKAGAA